jgi:hypothetical protein
MGYTLKFSDDVLESKGTSTLEPIPAGSYNATVFDIKEETVRSGLNEGKPRFNVQFRISEGQYENRRVFSYVPLYVANDAWKAAAFFKSLGYDVKAGNFKVPETADILGKAIGVRVKVGEGLNGEARNEVGGFDKPTTGADALVASLGAVPSEETW